jgi:MFS family permease
MYAVSAIRSLEHRKALVLGSFASFGVVWGMFAAAVPAIKSATGASDGALGAALSCSGLAALPAMFGIGRLVDRFGRDAFLAAVLLFAATAPLPLFVHSVPMLVAALLAFGGCSGAFDVVINHTGVEYEVASGRRVLNKAHALFSSGLLAGSFGAGALRGAGVRPGWLFLGFSLVLVAAAGPARMLLPARTGAAPAADPLADGDTGTAAEGEPDSAPTPTRRSRLSSRVWALGCLGILALLVENGVQQWCAVLLEDVLHAGPLLAGLGPAVFAAAAVAGRSSGQRLVRLLGDERLLICSGLVAAPGAVLTGAAASAPFALAGIALVGLGISVASPTLYGLAGRSAAQRDRGRTVAAVSGVAYVGLLGGPGLVGQVAGATNLHVALALLAPVALVMAAGMAVVSRRSVGLRPVAETR